MLEITPEPDYLGGHQQRLSIWAAVVTGLLAASITAVLLCRSPQSTTPQLALIVLAGSYLAITALSGATGSYIYWVRSRKWSTSELADLLQSTASAWVWIPAVVLLSRQSSIWSPVIAAVGAVVLAVSLRNSGHAAFNPNTAEGTAESSEQELFAQSLQSVPTEWYGPVVAISLCGEAIVLAQGWLFPACVLLAVAGFAFAWARTSALDSVRRKEFRRLTVVSLRQTKSALPALIVTVLAMAAGARHDLENWGIFAGAHGHGSDAPQRTHRSQPIAGPGGHVSIVLLTAPKEQRYVAPAARNPFLQGDRLIKPLVIQFDGEYWYFQPPYSEPGPGAYVAHDNPLITNIHSNISIPLRMQAHQHLGTPLPLGCCHEVDVQIESREDSAGEVVVGMMLTDTTSPGRPSLLLGERTIASNQQTPFTGKSASSTTTLRFPLPSGTGLTRERLHQFNQIDFVIVPDALHAQSGTKIAIRTLEFRP